MVISSKNSSSVPDQDLLTYLFSSISKEPDRPLFIDAHDDSRSLSWQQAHDMIRSIAGGLLQKGVKQHERVCVYRLNDIYYVPVVLGIIAAGAVAVPLSSRYSASKVASVLKDSNSSWIFAHPELASGEAASIAGLDKSHIVHFDPKDHFKDDIGTSFSSVIEQGPSEFIQVDPKTSTLLLSTSGTTGTPKLAVISHANLVAQQLIIDELGHHDKPYDVKWLWHNSQEHARSFTWPLSAFRTGHPVYILTGKHPEGISSAIRNHSITDALILPDDVKAMREHLGPTGHSHISTLKHVYVSSDPIEHFHYQSFSKLLGKEAQIARLMGITECSGVIFGLPWPNAHTERHAGEGWVGQLLIPSGHAKFIGSDGKDAGNGPGELCLQGPSVFQGYYNDREATLRAFTEDGFYRTGDIMQYDPTSKEYCFVKRQ